eukprot:jgi/Chlat1/2223/Chrsp17S02546
MAAAAMAQVASVQPAATALLTSLSSSPSSRAGTRRTTQLLGAVALQQQHAAGGVGAGGSSFSGGSNMLSQPAAFKSRQRRRLTTMAVASPAISSSSVGVAVAQGTARPKMEDAHTVVVGKGKEDWTLLGVFDGHGGSATAEFVAKNFYSAFADNVKRADTLTDALYNTYLEIDEELLKPPKGFFGAMMERGMGGSKCGATAVTALLVPGKGYGSLRLITANIGDSRAVLIRNGTPLLLSCLHTPDVAEERKRIEAKNPTPKKPLVVKAGGVWRVGGLLALSRAFGDVYLKDWSDGRDASGGFGLIAEPDMFDEDLVQGDDWLILASDGLWDYVSEEQAVKICQEAPGSESSEAVAKRLLRSAVEQGSTDDVTVLAVRLPPTLPGAPAAPQGTNASLTSAEI